MNTDGKLILSNEVMEDLFSKGSMNVVFKYDSMSIKRVSDRKFQFVFLNKGMPVAHLNASAFLSVGSEITVSDIDGYLNATFKV